MKIRMIVKGEEKVVKVISCNGTCVTMKCENQKWSQENEAVADLYKIYMYKKAQYLEMKRNRNGNRKKQKNNKTMYTIHGALKNDIPCRETNCSNSDKNLYKKAVACDCRRCMLQISGDCCGGEMFCSDYKYAPSETDYAREQRMMMWGSYAVNQF